MQVHLKHSTAPLGSGHETLKIWVAVKELKLSYYRVPLIMENQMEKNMENEMETGGILGFKGLKLSYSIGETLLFTIYTHYGNLI